MPSITDRRNRQPRIVPGDGADAPLQAAAADDGRGDGVQFVAAAEGLRIGHALVADEQDSGQRGAHGADAIGQPFQPVGADAAQPGGLFVAAQGVQMPADDRVPQQHAQRDGQQQEQDGRNPDRGGQVAKLAIEDLDLRAAAADESRP